MAVLSRESWIEFMKRRVLRYSWFTRSNSFVRRVGWVAQESGMERDVEGGRREVETGW